MSSEGRIFRVFVSSTFDDFKIERDALQRDVFPRLEQFCAERDARFQAIDLRWGISEEAASDQQTIAVCLQEVARCCTLTPRPNFIALVGDRYGWRPLPGRIPSARFNQVIEAADAADAKLLETWYREDTNAVPAAHTLLSRQDHLEDSSAWVEIEDRLRGAIEAILGRLPSATELEIRAGVLDPEHADGHALALVRRIADIPRNSTAKAFLDLDSAGRIDQTSRQQLDDLVSELKARLGARVSTYQAAWTGRAPDPITTDHVEPLCNDIYAHLEATISQELDRRKQRNHLDLEIAAHEHAARSWGQTLVGRESELQTLLEWVAEPGGRMGVVHGPWGSGKTALAGRLIRTIAERRPDAIVIARFLATYPSATVLRGLLESLIRQISGHLDAEPDIPSTVDELVTRFLDCIRRLTTSGPVIVLLDGVDLLATADSAHTFFWLPSIIPPGVTILVTCSTGECSRLLLQRFPEADTLVLGDLPTASAAGLVRAAVAAADRDLQPAQWDVVDTCLARNSLPLFVELIGEEVLGWRSFDRAAALPTSVEALVRNRVADLKAGRNHGSVLVSRSLGYLEAAKNGLAEDELLTVLSADPVVMADFRDRNPQAPEIDILPVVVWSRLRFDLGRYLQEFVADGLTLLSFRHRQVESILRDDVPEEQTRLHGNLAAHFTQARRANPDPHRRAVAELPYQLSGAGDWEALESILTDVRFLEDKLRVGQGYELLADFERLDERGELDDPRIGRCRLLGRSLSNVFDFVRDTPARLGPQLHLELIGEDPESIRDLLFRVEEGCADRVWLQQYLRRGRANAFHEAQTGFDRNYIHFVRFAPDDQSLLYADVDGRLTRWNWSTGLRTATAVPATFKERSFLRQGALLGSSGFAFASAQCVWALSVDDIWSGDLKRGVWKRVLEAAPGESFECLAADTGSPNALLVVRIDHASFLQTIDRTSGAVLSRKRIPEFHPQQLANGIAAGAGGRPFAVCFDTGQLVVSTGLAVRAHVGGALHCEFTPNGEQIVTCGVDGTVAIFDPERGLLSRVELRYGAAECLACAPSGRLLAIGHRDGQVSLVDRNPPLTVRTFSPGVAGWILSLAFSGCGRFLAVGGRNGGARIYDVDKVPASGPIRHMPRGDAVWATHLQHEGACLFEDGEGYLFSTSTHIDTAQLPLRTVTKCIDRSRGNVLALIPGLLRALDAESGSVIYEQDVPDTRRYAATMSADGSTLALLEGDGVAILNWQPHEPHWVERRKLAIPGGHANTGNTVWHLSVPLLLTRDGRILFLPLEPETKATLENGVIESPKLDRRLCVLDTASGVTIRTFEYRGFCTALAEWPAENAMIVGFGDGPIQLEQGMIWDHGDRGIRVYSLNDGKLLRRITTPRSDLGINGITIDPTQQVVASTSRGGTVRIDPLRTDSWSASLRMPSPALAPQFDETGRVLWVPDNGRGDHHWPTERYFLVKFIRPETPGAS